MKLAALTVLLAAPLAIAQSSAPPDFSSLTPVPKRHIQYVEYAAEPLIIAAGRPAMLELRFHVVDGFHINSHQPKSDLQIPTRIELTPAAGVRIGKPTYPAGQLFSFAFAPKDKLDVYQGEFIVRLPVTASPGPHLLTGSLRYQACDHAACYPPKTLPIGVAFTASAAQDVPKD